MKRNRNTLSGGVRGAHVGAMCHLMFKWTEF